MVETTNEADGVEAVENAAEPVQEPESKRGVRILGSPCRRGKSGDVADVKNAASKSGVE